MMYHVNGERCQDSWNCLEIEHRSWMSCAAQEQVAAKDSPLDCYLPKGHPGPHRWFQAARE